MVHKNCLQFLTAPCDITRDASLKKSICDFFDMCDITKQDEQVSKLSERKGSASFLPISSNSIVGDDVDRLSTITCSHTSTPTTRPKFNEFNFRQSAPFPQPMSRCRIRALFSTFEKPKASTNAVYPQAQSVGMYN